MKLELKKEFSVGNIITTFSVLISSIALLVSWSHDRSLLRHKQANEVRNAAALTMAKLERWREIALYLYWDIQPSLIKTSEMLATGRDSDNVTEARDYLYKQIQRSRLTTKQILVDEEIETAYVYLYSFHPKMRKRLGKIIEALWRLEESAYNDLLRETQNQVLSYFNPNIAEKPYKTAHLGNRLRNAAVGVSERYKNKIDQTLMPMKLFLGEIVIRSDRELVDSKLWIKWAGEEYEISEAFRIIARERSIAESAFGLLKIYCKEDPGCNAQGIYLYENAQADFNGFIERLIVHIKSLTITQPRELNTALKKAVAQRLAFTDYVDKIGGLISSRRSGDPERFGVEVELISALEEATRVIIGFHRGRIKAPVSIVDQLEALMWRPFSEIGYAVTQGSQVDHRR